MSVAADPRLILREDELDAGLELLLLAEAALWSAVDQGLAAADLGLGRSHWRAAFLLRRRPGMGVQDLAHLTSLSKQAASRILVDLEAKGLAAKATGDLDGRRRTAILTPAGEAFESAIGERLTLPVQTCRMRKTSPPSPGTTRWTYCVCPRMQRPSGVVNCAPPGRVRPCARPPR